MKSLCFSQTVTVWICCRAFPHKSCSHSANTVPSTQPLIPTVTRLTMGVHWFTLIINHILYAWHNCILVYGLRGCILHSNAVPLQWCYMSIMAPDITDNIFTSLAMALYFAKYICTLLSINKVWILYSGNSTVCSRACSGSQQAKHLSSAFLSLCEGNPLETSGFPS